MRWRSFQGRIDRKLHLDLSEGAIEGCELMFNVSRCERAAAVLQVRQQQLARALVELMPRLGS